MIKLLSLFSGIGAFETALRRGGHEYQLIGYCEIDKYAANAYSQIHGVSENYNLVDVTKVNTVLMDDVDLITYGFPCQDISAAGKQRGFEDKDGNRTRSGLFFEALRIIEETRPLYAIAENVKALTSKKFEKEFKTVLDSLNDAGYNNYWAVLNAKDYGIPQNRERVFIVSIRKDIDNGGFKFPEKMPLNIRVKDILENSVDEKYYINTEKARQLIKKLLDKNRITGVEVCDATVNAPNVRDISNAIISRYDAGISNQRSWGTAVIEPHVKRLGNLYSETAGGARAGNTYDPEGLSPTLQTAQGGNRQPLIVIGSEQKHASITTDGTSPCLTAMMGLGGGNVPMVTEPVICASRGRNPDNPGDRTAGAPTEQRLEPNMDGVSNTLTTVQKDNYVVEHKIIDDTFGFESEARIYDNTAPALRSSRSGLKVTDAKFRIRKLTPLECFRLMGFSDEEFNRIKGVSNTQLYKMAGNSIVVNVLEGIFNNLLRC